MTPRLCEATYVADYKIRLRYADGVEGIVDLLPQLWGEVFEPLKDLQRFREFTLDAELQTLSWPTGADFAPEFLYAQTSQASP